MIKDNSYRLINNTPTLFLPNVVRTTFEQNGLVLKSSNLQEYDQTELGSSSSYKYDLFGNGLKSTQQLNIDWSKFEEHTFFNSAQVKTNIAFDKIFNQFPFDGTKKEYETFFDQLTGFEKYVYDNFPKYKGYAFFSGSSFGETNAGTWITVKDIQGAQYTELAKDPTGNSILNPGLNSITVEMHLFLPEQANNSQTVLNKLSQSNIGYDGFALVLSGTNDTQSASMYFCVASGSKNKVVDFSFDKGNFHHLAIMWDRNPAVNKLLIYKDNILIKSSSGFELNTTFWQRSDLIIGSGSSFTFNEYQHTEETTLSGAIDELRIWHKIRTNEDLQEYEKKSLFANEDLKLYFKFNEPLECNSLLTIDSSGNSLHGKLNIYGNTLGVRNISTSSIAGESPMTYEKLSLSPNLFPQTLETEYFRELLLYSASIFDSQNPSLITKLVPKHYFFEGQIQDALETENGDILTELNSSVEPQTTKLGNTQILMSLLYVWAKYFDELKLYIEAFGNLNYVDYNLENTIPDTFLQFLANQYGINLPSLFSQSSINQFIEGEDIQDTISTNSLSLQSVQNTIWRRILINLQDILKSKGTIHSIKSFIRTMGIDPDNNFRIREYGGPTKAQLNWVRESRSEISSLLNFVSGGLVSSSYLVADKIEPGFPYSNYPGSGSWDRLLTSGSFTVESWFQFPKDRAYYVSQSLIKTFVTGQQSSSPNQTETLISNIIYTLSGNTTLYLSPNNIQYTLPISGANLFDGDKWFVSFGRQRGDDNLNLNGYSKYFLRVGKPLTENEIELYTTESVIYEDDISGSIFSLLNNSNASGSWISIGSKSIDTNSSYLNLLYLNNTSSLSDQTYTNFQGNFGHFKFYSKYIDSTEATEHIKNFKSLGVRNPLLNFNFNTTESGSWEKLRIDVSTDQEVTKSDSGGNIILKDFSQNNFDMIGSMFPSTASVIIPEKFYYSLISSKFDEASTINKIRTRSFEQIEQVVSNSYATLAPLYELNPSELPTDTTKFSIDFSIVDALDQDIINIFATLESLDNVIGNPELLFSPDYPGLEFLRQIYFNRLTDKINIKLFFEFYKWFDTNIGLFIQQLIPRKTKFLGTSYVIESHMLERPKFEYNISDIYLGDSNRHGLKDTLRLQLINGLFHRY